LNDKLLFSEKKNKWKYQNNMIISEQNQALDTWTDPEHDSKGNVKLYQINGGRNQLFKIEQEMIKTTYGNKNLSINDTFSLGFGYEYPIQFSLEEVTENEININYLSYNILVGHPYYENELIKSDKKFLPWINRKDKIKQYISLADLGVLVESLEEKLSDILPINYKYSFMNKVGDRDGTTIFYNNDKYEAIDQFVSGLIPGTTQVVLRVTLKDKQTNKIFIVIGLHLKSGYEPEEKRRAREMEIALSKSLDGIPEDIPVIVSGDFNCDLRGGYELTSLKVLEKYGFQQVSLLPDEITYNHWHPSIFDYIYVRGNVRYTNSYTGVKIQDSTPSPNETQGSDHFPLRAKLNLHTN
jgi:hypothetical protein